MAINGNIKPLVSFMITPQLRKFYQDHIFVP